jgi:hypothetical protein
LNVPASEFAGGIGDARRAARCAGNPASARCADGQEISTSGFLADFRILHEGAGGPRIIG